MESRAGVVGSPVVAEDRQPAGCPVPVDPCACALAVAIPLTREEFLADLEDPDKDCAKHIVRKHEEKGVDAEYYWQHVYGPVALFTGNICRAVDRKGVTVVYRARLHDLTYLLTHYAVTTLVTHWRFGRIEPGDLLDPMALFQALRTGESDISRAVARNLERRGSPLLALPPLSQEPEALASVLAIELNRIISEAHSDYDYPPAPAKSSEDGQSGETIGETDALAAPSSMIDLPDRLTRPVLEAAFPGWIRPFPAVEFADGMKAVGEVVNAFPAEFASVIDLSVCNSVVLGNLIKRARPTATVVMNRYPANLDARIVLYRRAIEFLARRPQPFIEALGTAHRQP